jgi:hypothetical protein
VRRRLATGIPYVPLASDFEHRSNATQNNSCMIIRDRPTTGMRITMPLVARLVPAGLPGLWPFWVLAGCCQEQDAHLAAESFCPVRVTASLVVASRQAALANLGPDNLIDVRRAQPVPLNLTSAKTGDSASDVRAV